MILVLNFLSASRLFLVTRLFSFSSVDYDGLKIMSSADTKHGCDCEPVLQFFTLTSFYAFPHFIQHYISIQKIQAYRLRAKVSLGKLTLYYDAMFVASPDASFCPCCF